MRGCVFALLLAASAAAAQIVEGAVVSTKGGALPGVSVTLVKALPPFEATASRTVTDAQGAFRLENVPEGAYVFDLQVDGFFGPSPGTAGNRPFAVSAGTSKPLTLEMAPFGRISVRVVDSQGAPVAGAELELAAPYGVVQQQTAGADGRFTFADVRPGNYKLRALTPTDRKPPVPVDSQELGWLPTFFGGAADRERAAPILVVEGGEFACPDLKLLTAPAHRIRGMVFDADGNAASGVKVGLWAEDIRGHERTVVSHGDGSFEFGNVTDGQWRLSSESGSEAEKAAGWLSVQMSGKDLESQVLHMVKPFSIHGQVSFEPPEGARLPVAVLFRSENGASFLGSRVTNGGGFAVEGLYPGVYGITVTPPIPDGRYYLDSIRVGERDALTREVSIVSGLEPISIRFKAGSSAVRGSVEECGAAVVLLLPQERRIRRQGITRQVRCSEGNQFEIPSVRPGEYYLLALAPNSSVLAPPYDLDQDYLNHAQKVSVAGNASVRADLKVMPNRGF